MKFFQTLTDIYLQIYVLVSIEISYCNVNKIPDLNSYIVHYQILKQNQVPGSGHIDRRGAQRLFKSV